jgi:hypothetical protein
MGPGVRRDDMRMIFAGLVQHRHCERSEAIHLSAKKESWIASSLRSSQ